MEAVKCPNCGSEKVQGLTEEKYVCLACDNVFLVHNLSKEFRMTDEHITEMHGDITSKLDEIKDSTESGGTMRLKEQAIDAECLLKEDVLGAYEGYKKYAMMASDSALGYEGMFRALSYDYSDDSVTDKKNDLDDPGLYDILYNGFDVLMKALGCKDVVREELLGKVLARHKKGAKHLVYNALFDDDDYNPNQAYTSVCEWITDYENEINQKKEELQELNKQIEEYENLSKNEKIKKLIISKLPSVILFVIGLMVGKGFLQIILFIVAVICFFSIKDKPNSSDYLQDEIADMQQILDRLTKGKKMMEDIDALTIDDMENIIHENHAKGGNIEKMYDRVRTAIERQKEEERLEAERQAELAEGYFQVQVQNWGRNREQVRDILKRYCNDTGYVKNCYKNNLICTISGFRKSEARQLQEELFQAGAIAVCKNI